MRIAPCTAAPYSTASSGLMDLFALCCRRTLGSRSALLGFRSSLPQAPSHARSSPRYLCLAGTHHEVHLLYQATHGCRFRCWSLNGTWCAISSFNPSDRLFKDGLCDATCCTSCSLLLEWDILAENGNACRRSSPAFCAASRARRCSSAF